MLVSANCCSSAPRLASGDDAEERWIDEYFGSRFGKAIEVAKAGRFAIVFGPHDWRDEISLLYAPVFLAGLFCQLTYFIFS
jgi:hypothetical protein